MTVTEQNAGDGPPITIALVTCEPSAEAVTLLANVLRTADPRDQILVVNDAREFSAGEAFAAAPRLIRTGGIGAGGARNAALRESEHEWIVFLDDDIEIPNEFLTHARALLAAADFDVLTMRVNAVDCEAGRVFDERYSLSRGEAVVYFRGHTGTEWHPNDAWRVGVGTCMAWRGSELRRISGFPVPLGQGLRYGGAEDLAAYRNALVAGLTVRYDGQLAVVHGSPRTFEEFGSMMRRYACSGAAHAAHVLMESGDTGMRAHVLRDLRAFPKRLLAESARAVRREPHVPLAALVLYPWDVARGYYGYRRWRRAGHG